MPKQVRDEWLAAPLVLWIARDLALYGAGEALAQCSALNDAISDHETARAFTDRLLENMLPVLRAQPIGEAPFQFKVSRGLSTIQLIRTGGATLSLAAYEPIDGVSSPLPAPDSALFCDREVHEIVLSGKATGVVHERTAEGSVASQMRPWRCGDTIALNARTQARQVIAVERALLLLQLTREPGRPAPTHLVALNSGEVLRTASGDKSASQAVMALSVLGALGDTDALGVMVQTALNPAEDAEVRWEAVRQTLGLDPARGLDLLGLLALRAGDPIARSACNLKAELLRFQPELRALINEAAG